MQLDMSPGDNVDVWGWPNLHRDGGSEEGKLEGFNGATTGWVLVNTDESKACNGLDGRGLGVCDARQNL